jgi:hypothetical protein
LPPAAAFVLLSFTTTSGPKFGTSH